MPGTDLSFVASSLLYDLPKLDGESHVAETDCFTTLHIRPHPRNDLANIANRGFMRDGAREVGDGRETRTYFSFSPAGN